MKRAGFTLIELLTVVVIIALVAGTGIPKLTNLKTRAQVAAIKSDLRNLVTIQESYFAQNQKYATDLGSAYTVSAGERHADDHADRGRLDCHAHERQRGADVRGI